jgi:tight adherence protein B
MTVLVITAAVFVVTLGLCATAMYFLLGSPARFQLQVRLPAIQQIKSTSEAPDDLTISLHTGKSLPAIDRMIARLPGGSRLKLFMLQAAVRVPVTTFLLFCVSGILGAVLIGLAAHLPATWTLGIALVLGSSPGWVVSHKRRKRLAQFEELFPDAIDTMARAVRAGHPFTTAFSFVAAELPEPVAGEFRMTFEQQNLGMPLAEALRNLTLRIPLTDVRIFVTALSIQREAGGNLGEILDNLSGVIRDRFRILRQVQVFAAEGRLSMYILMALPPVAGLLMYLVNPKYMMRLFTDPLGQKAVSLAVLLQVIGYFVIRRIIRIRV